MIINQVRYHSLFFTKKKWLFTAPPLICVFLFNGCLYTTHHFNTGRILKAGETAFSAGIGSHTSFSASCPDSAGSNAEIKNPDDYYNFCADRHNYKEGEENYADLKQIPPVYKTKKTLNYSASFRMGVLDNPGPFTGLEIGAQLEAATNPASTEFFISLGLPSSGHANHSITLGWITGFWVDNTWFIEYALSWGRKGKYLFANARLSHLATQFMTVQKSLDDLEFSSDKKYIHQYALGAKWELPHMLIVPDYLIIQAILTTPVAPDGKVRFPPDKQESGLWSTNLGFGWHFK